VNRSKPALLALAMLLAMAGAAAADALFLQSGRQLNVAVREISDGVVYFVSNGEIHSLPLTEVKKIIMAGVAVPENAGMPPTAGMSPAGVSPATAPPVPPVPAAPPAPLELVATSSSYDRGVLTVQGEVRNNTDQEIKFVQLVVTLHDESDSVLATPTYLYAPGPTPHLQAGESRAFRVAFIAPPPTTYKYKVSAESRYLNR